MNNKLYLSLLGSALCAISAAAEPVQVSVQMNTTTRTMQLVPFSGGEPVNVGEPASNKYTFEAEPGRYLLSGYTSAGLRNGTLVVDIAEGIDLKVLTVTAKATNSGWVLGKDYTVKTAATNADGESREYITGVDKAQQTAVTFLALNGDVYSVSLIPNDAHKAEGYLTYTESNALTFNKTVSKAIPMGRTFKLTVPTGATPFVGSKVRHFSPFTPMDCYASEENGETTTYSYILAENTEYNYRVSMDGKLTNAGKFKMPTDNHEIVVTEEDMSGDPKAIDRDLTSNNKYNVADIYLNAPYTGELRLAAGSTFQIVNLRNWEIVDGLTNNYFFEPDYHYAVVDLDGQPSTAVAEVSADGLVTAKGSGTAIVLVTYDALRAPGQAGGPDFGAIWPENTGVIIVNVDGADSGINPNMLINADANPDNNDKLSGQNLDAEMDVIYFTGDLGEYTFSPEGAQSVTMAVPTVGEKAVSYSGFSADNVIANADGSYTLRLGEGRNIVRLSNAAGETFRVIRAHKVSYTVANISREGEDPMPGDEVSVTINNIFHPANKLAGVYNMSAKVQYDSPEGSATATKANQYQFAATDAARTVSVTIPADWNVKEEYRLNGGVIVSTGFGDPYGGHREITYENGKSNNFTALQHSSSFGSLPEIALYIPAAAVADFENINLQPESHWNGDENGEEWYYGLGYSQKLQSGDYLFPNFYLPDYETWIGYAVSNETSTEYSGVTDQFRSCVGHGADGSANYGVAYPDGSMWNETLAIENKDNEMRTVPGFYITNTAWVVNAINHGDNMTPGGFKAGDWFRITIHALDAEGKETASRNFCLADYRFEDPADRYYIKDWTYVDLSQLGDAAAYKFSFDGSRKNTYGLTTPTYFCIDNFGAKGHEDVREEGTFDATESGIEDVAVENAQPEIFTIDGIRVDSMDAPGLYIVNGHKVLKR